MCAQSELLTNNAHHRAEWWSQWVSRKIDSYNVPKLPSTSNHSAQVKISVFGGQLSLQWRHNGRDGVSNYQSQDCLLNRLLRCWSKKTLKLRVTGLCVGNSPGSSEFPAQMASYAENVSIWWRHHGALPFTINEIWLALCADANVWLGSLNNVVTTITKACSIPQNIYNSWPYRHNSVWLEYMAHVTTYDAIFS